MTVTQAAAKWGVKEHTVLGYIGKGYIYGLTVAETAEQNYIILPGIPAPLVRKKPKTVAAMDKYILDAMDSGMYVNANIMGISQEKFEERLNALSRSNRIYCRNPALVDYSSNLGFVLSCEGGTRISVNISPSITPTLELKPSVEVKVADQIGLVNADIKLPFGKGGAQ